jgi:hypothetical protein
MLLEFLHRLLLGQLGQAEPVERRVELKRFGPGLEADAPSEHLHELVVKEKQIVVELLEHLVHVAAKAVRVSVVPSFVRVALLQPSRMLHDAESTRSTAGQRVRRIFATTGTDRVPAIK